MGLVHSNNPCFLSERLAHLSIYNISGGSRKIHSRSGWEGGRVIYVAPPLCPSYIRDRIYTDRERERESFCIMFLRFFNLPESQIQLVTSYFISYYPVVNLKYFVFNDLLIGHKLFWLDCTGPLIEQCTISVVSREILDH